MDVLIGQLATGLSLGSILLLAALGLALTFGQMGVINMAHGEFIMAGCYTAFVVQKFISNAGASLLISLVVGFVVGGLLGVLLEVTLIQRMYDRPLDTLLVTFGVGLILQQVARDLFGAPAVNVVAPTWLSGGVEILGAVVPKTRIFILVLAVVCVTVLAVGAQGSARWAGGSAPSCRTGISPRPAAFRLAGRTSPPSSSDPAWPVSPVSP